MRLATIALLLAALTISACGDDAGDSSADGGSTGAAAATDEAPPAPGGGDTALDFSAVEDFTLETLGGEPAVAEECGDLAWADEQAKEADGLSFPGTTSHEVLACDGVPYVFYFEYQDDAALEEGLGQAQLPYLRAGTTVVQPGVALDSAAAKAYLEALAAECGCGEVVDPAA